MIRTRATTAFLNGVARVDIVEQTASSWCPDRTGAPLPARDRYPQDGLLGGYPTSRVARTRHGD